MITINKGHWRIVLDEKEIIKDDPGAGTPVMLYGPGDISGTYFCALDTGECDSKPIPASVQRWLESMEDEINLWLDLNSN